jgi:hypothetical protein
MLAHLAVEFAAEAPEVAVSDGVVCQLFDHLLNGVGFGREGAVRQPNVSTIDVVLAHFVSCSHVLGQTEAVTRKKMAGIEVWFGLGLRFCA